MPLGVVGITTKIMLESTRGQHCMQKHLYEHFDLPGHTNFLEDVTGSLIDKTDPRDPAESEDYWIYTLKTKAPWVLICEDDFLV